MSSRLLCSFTHRELLASNSEVQLLIVDAQHTCALSTESAPACQTFAYLNKPLGGDHRAELFAKVQDHCMHHRQSRLLEQRVLQHDQPPLFDVERTRRQTGTKFLGGVFKVALPFAGAGVV